MKRKSFVAVAFFSAKKASPAASLLIAQLQRTVFELEGPLL